MAKLIAFICPDCGKDITASSSERNTRCEHCGKLIHLTNRPDPLPDNVKLIVPVRVKVEHTEDVLRIQYAWFKTGYIGVFLFAFTWNLMLPIFFTPLFMSDAPAHTFIPMIIMPVVGILMLGWAIVHLFNRTVIEIRGDQLTIRFAPFPWFGSMSIQTSELTRLVCTRRIVQRERNLGGYQVRGFSIAYIEHEIYAYQKSSPEEFLLLSNLPSTEAAYFVKHMIEVLAGIE